MRLLRALENRLLNMIGRGILTALNDSQGLQLLSLKGMPGEELRDVERVQNYGFTGVPKEGAHAIVIFPQGDRNHGIAIAVDDLDARLRDLAPGQVALYDSVGSKVLADDQGAMEVSGKTAAHVSGGVVATLKAPESVVVEAEGDTSQAAGATETAIDVAQALVALTEVLAGNADVAGVTEALAALGGLTAGGQGGDGQVVVRGASDVQVDGDTVTIDGGSYVSIGGAAVMLQGGVLFIEASAIAIQGALLINGTPYLAHTHDDVQSGSSTSGPVTAV